MRYKTLIYQLDMLYKFLAISLLLCGCGAQSNSSALSADISGPFTDLDENIFYPEGHWYKIALKNRADSTLYIPVFSNRAQIFSPYSMSHYFSKDSVRGFLSDRFTDTLIPLLPKSECTFFFALREFPHEQTDSFLLFFHFYPDTSLHHQRVLEVKCLAETPPKLKVFSPR